MTINVLSPQLYWGGGGGGGTCAPLEVTGVIILIICLFVITGCIEKDILACPPPPLSSLDVITDRNAPSDCNFLNKTIMVSANKRTPMVCVKVKGIMHLG